MLHGTPRRENHCFQAYARRPFSGLRKTRRFRKSSKYVDNIPVWPSCTLSGMPNSISRTPLLTLQSRARFPQDPPRAPGPPRMLPRAHKDVWIPPKSARSTIKKHCKYKHLASKEHEERTFCVLVKVLVPSQALPSSCACPLKPCPAAQGLPRRL